MGNVPQAQWIWLSQPQIQPYHQTIIARKVFSAADATRAVLKITADSAYRLCVNGVWINDGPCRAWPEHYQYDELDITGYLKSGENELRITATYWGTGTFHQVPQQPGVLAELTLTDPAGSAQIIATDATWDVAEAAAWIRNTPKVSIQMPPQELYDATLEDQLVYAPAAALFAAEDGPWQDLHPRDVRLLTKDPLPFKAFLGAQVVRASPDLHYCIPTARLAHPNLIEANRNVMQVGAIATQMVLMDDAVLRFAAEGVAVYVDGEQAVDDQVHLTAGTHLLTAFVVEATGHRKEKELRLIEPPATLRTVNPLNDSADNAWCWIDFPEFSYAGDDLEWPEYDPPADLKAKLRAYTDRVAELGAEIRTPGDLCERLGKRVRQMPATQMFVQDTHWRFLQREPVAEAAGLVESPSALIYDNAETTTVHPSADGDIELLYDLGEQAIGYLELDLIASAGVEIDIYAVEFIAPDGEIQHTWGNRNGMRYITREGHNHFISTRRRSGRYFFITLRNQDAPVHIRQIRLIAATYPVSAVDGFRCSDEHLNQIWEISARTLRLCMEDTFTDCPLYEQTLWVGDARNEALFAFSAFGTSDIAKRCARLAGQSLERYPIVGSQVPTCWDVLLPAWSFLWGISIWDIYEFTGDGEFLREMWPAVIRNLQGASNLRDTQHGLFKGPFWNMFDWSGIDDNHEIVLHNSMLFVGAVNAALACAEVLHDRHQQAWLTELREALCGAINRLWDPEKGAYPDSIHADGTVSEAVSQHTSFLALLYDILPQAHREAALAVLLDPPADVTQVGSPFAMLYYYEALEKTGRPDAILSSIRDAYIPMLEAGATTVWEVFPSSESRPGGFPTRSHCHAWSSAPVYYLNRIILGIRSLAPGGTRFEVSPRLQDLAWAEGSVQTAQGPLHVRWHADEGTLNVAIGAPPDVEVAFVKNETHQDRQLTIEQERT